MKRTASRGERPVKNEETVILVVAGFNAGRQGNERRSP